MKQLTSILVFVLGMIGSTMAQPISNIKVGVNGLTCSACSKSVEMSLKRLDFIDSVTMSLENTEGIIYVKKMYPIDFNKIAKAVTDAGFSMRTLEATFSLGNTAISEQGCFSFAGINFQWVDYSKEKNQTHVFTFVDGNFLPGKESNRWKKKINNNNCFSNQEYFHIAHVE